MPITDRPVNNSILYDESGKAILVDSGNGALIVGGLEHAIGDGLISTAGVSSDHAKGYVATASTSITVARASTYVEPASASQMEILSSSASDSSAGTGTRTVRITYYDGSLNGPFTEDKTMNGVAAVTTTATNMRFIDKIETLSVGSNGTNVGTITLRAVSAGATVGTIAVSDGITFWAHKYVPVNTKCFIKRWFVGVLGNSGVTFLRTNQPLTGVSFEKQMTPSVRVTTAQPSQIYDMEHFIVPGPAKISAWVRADSNTAATWHVGFSFYCL